MEEKSYQDNGGLHRKPYNFFIQEVKRKIRIGAPLSGHLIIYRSESIYYLTIIPRARMGSESIANEAEGQVGLLT